jgi:uncharacterized BrkB/YihY/UPF0761 family membrane protein
MALATCVLLSAGVALVALLGTGLGWIWRLTGAHLLEATAIAESSAVGHLVRRMLGAVIAFGLTSAVFVLGVPKEARAKMPIVPGAMLAVALETVLSLGYAYYISKVGTGGAYQAGLGAVGVTMMTIYFFAVALLVGLELNVVLRDKRGGRRTSA